MHTAWGSEQPQAVVEGVVTFHAPAASDDLVKIIAAAWGVEEVEPATRAPVGGVDVGVDPQEEIIVCLQTNYSLMKTYAYASM